MSSYSSSVASDWLVLAAELGRLAPTAEKSLVEEALDPEPVEERPIADLLRLERELSMASARQFDLHYRLRPVLRDVAAARARAARDSTSTPAARPSKSSSATSSSS